MADATIPNVTEINCTTGVVTERPMTDAEIAAQAQAAADYAAKQAADEAAKQAAAAGGGPVRHLSIDSDEVVVMSSSSPI